MTDDKQPTLSISLSSLALWEGNVRKTAIQRGLDELSASILAHGLLNPLHVCVDAGGEYHVVAGQRRLLALRRLAEAGEIASDWPVACRLLGEESALAEIGLAENVMREQMHPADQFVAFEGLAREGMPVADIAARFGASDLTVQRLLRLGRVAPAILDAYRAGELKLDQVQAFAVTEDQAAQLAVWESLQARHHASHAGSIRAALTQDEPSARDRIARFVGLEAYEAAGGGVRRDLFDAEASTLLDKPLLLRLYEARMADLIAEIEAEGWSWVETRESVSEWQLRQEGLERLPAEFSPLTSEQEEKRLALQESLEDLEADAEDGTLEDEQTAQDEAERLMQEIEAIEGEREAVWSAEAKALSGALIAIGPDGGTEIRRGVVRKTDRAKARALRADPAATEERAASGVSSSKGLPAALKRDLSAQRTAALRVELARQPQVALAAIVHRLILETFPQGAGSCSLWWRERSCLTVSPHVIEMERYIEGAPALKTLAQAREAFDLPKEDLFGWCLRQEQATLLRLLALALAPTVSALEEAPNFADSRQQRHADALAQALSLDMRAWFTPTAENYFSRITRAQILESWEEMTGQPPAPDLASLKKPSLAARAEGETAGRGWLPEALRAPETPQAEETDEEAETPDAAA